MQLKDYFLSLSRSRISVSRTSSFGGSAGFSSSFFLPISIALLTALMMQNRIRAMMRKLMTAEMKLP